MKHVAFLALREYLSSNTHDWVQDFIGTYLHSSFVQPLFSCQNKSHKTRNKHLLSKDWTGTTKYYACFKRHILGSTLGKLKLPCVTPKVKGKVSICAK